MRASSLLVVRVGLFFAAIVATGADRALAAPPNLILHHGRIVTVNDRFEVVDAVAIKGERIAAVGSNDEVLKLRGEETEVIDLGGKMVLPGLIDSHVHPSDAAMHEFDHPVPDMETVGDVLAYIKSRAEAVKEDEWISVSQVFITRLREQRFPTRAELDAAAPKNPVVFATGPDAMLNSRALALSGIDRDFKVSGSGEVQKDPKTGEPTGLLRSCGRYIKSKSSGKSATDQQRSDRLVQLLRDYNSVGITGMIDRHSGGSAVARYEKLRDRKELTVRTAVSWHLDNGSPEALRERVREVAKQPLCQGDSRLRIIGVKMYLDGGMLTGSAFMRQPWGVSSIYSITDPQYRGVRFIPDDALLAVVRECVDHKLQFTAHSVGDGAVHALLDAYEATSKDVDIRPARPCITHCNFMSREAVDKMARLGVVADIQPAWLYLDARTLTAQFGDERLSYFQPLKQLFDAGAIVGGGSDHMQKIGSLRSINPYNPFLAMWVAQSRKARWFEGQLHPENALSREQAIRFYTRNNAYIMFQEKELGSLEVGKLADLIVVDRDLLRCPLDEIRDTQVLRTYFGGRLVYEKKP